MAKKQSECAIQIMFFSKNKKQSLLVHDFIKRFPGEILVSIPINPRGGQK